MKKMKELHFGTAGIPVRAKGADTASGIETVHELGLSSMELEFVRNVTITEAKAPEVARSAKKNKVELTCHASYFINLNAVESEKVVASRDRILKAARMANLCGAYSVTFHAAFYLKQEPDKVYKKVKKELQWIVNKLRGEDIDIWIRPETTGKGSQFGTVDEIIELSNDIEGVMPCVDFSHLHARSGGKFNTKEEFDSILEKIEKGLGKKGLRNMHIHLSGIQYTDKGERNHLILEESDMNYKDLLRSFIDFKIKGVLICESPNLEDDAMLLKKTYDGFM